MLGLDLLSEVAVPDKPTDPRNLADSLNDTVLQIRENSLKLQKETILEEKIKLTSALFGQASAYTNLIIIAGYAGFFAIWSFTKDFLPETATITVALLMSVSILAFVLFEIYKMLRNTFDLSPIIALLNDPPSPEQFFEKLAALSLAQDRAKLKLFFWWKISLWVTVIAGFGAALILLYNFIANLTGLPYFPEWTKK